MEKVTVLLSSYNGEKYIAEQLQSLVAQQGVTIDILVRDDGSKDSTTKILDEWQDKERSRGTKREILAQEKALYICCRQRLQVAIMHSATRMTCGCPISCALQWRR